MISMDAYVSGISCVINSRQAPQGGMTLSALVHGNHAENLAFSVCDHVEDGIAFCAYPQRTGRVDTDAHINFT